MADQPLSLPSAPDDDATRLGALLRQRLQADEETRHHLARTLHDELGSLLTAIKLDLSWMRRQACAQDDKVQEKLARVVGLLDDGIALKRRLIEELRPSVLAHLGLRDALAVLLDQAAATHGWAVQLDAPDPQPALPEPMALALYRITQGALDNIARHAGARRVAVALTDADGHIELTVRDDGHGVAADLLGTLPAGAHGLLEMRQRLLTFGGDLSLSGAPGAGATLVVRVPLVPASPG
ncbi:sensor histidine kinase [Chitiniphilus eburneus]|nr:sensor histidine kinase [Chitiniphilus eburneus]